MKIQYRSILAAILLLASAAFLTGCSSSSTAPGKGGPDYVLGEDYTFPYAVQPEPFSGYICDSCENSQTVNAGLGWKDFEPERGVYDFSALESVLAKAQAKGKTVTLHLHSITDSGHNSDNSIIVLSQVPDWVFDYYGLDRTRLPSLLGDFYLKIIPQWKHGIDADFNTMVKALGSRFAADPRLSSIYLHGISFTRGEELVLNASLLSILEAPRVGLSSSVLKTWITDRMDAYAEAFKGYEYKVAWVGAAHDLDWMGRPDYEQVALELLQYAWSKGFGNRHGGIERYFNDVDEPAFANELDANGYLTLDDASVVFDGRYLGEENEEYGAGWAWRYGTSHSDSHRYRMAMMRVLQQRYNWLWTSSAAEAINPPLSDYARLLMGKNVDNSPDAWAFLFEAPMSAFYSYSLRIRNFERFLYQRDYPEGLTVPAQQRLRSFNAGGVNSSDPLQYYEYTVRRTDLASGNKYIYFHLDDGFVTHGNPLLKVEILDNSTAEFTIEYLDVEGASREAQHAFTQDDGKVKTYTLGLSDAAFENGMEHDTDLRIVNLGPGDLSVRWVRLIKDQP